ncbi:MAG: hypothetical protein PUE95_05870 [Lachnospiraceae bacterium]|nr:hypothetical protein [Lachnospiraceae bacterium]
MKCKQCSAEFDDNLPQCPYCGALNYTGAEQEYFEHLHNLNDEMAEMSNDSEETYKSGFQKSMTIVIGIIGGLILLIGLLIGLFFLYHNIEDKKNEEAYHASRVWKNTYYEELDAMYAQGNYDEILQFLNDHVDDKGYYPYEWEHLDFIQAYEKYQNFLEDSANFDSNNLTYMYWTLYEILYMQTIVDQPYLVYSEEELAQIAEWKAETYAFLTDHMGLTESEIEEMKKETLSDDYAYPVAEKCKKYIKKRYNL